MYDTASNILLTMSIGYKPKFRFFLHQVTNSNQTRLNKSEKRKEKKWTLKTKKRSKNKTLQFCLKGQGLHDTLLIKIEDIDPGSSTVRSLPSDWVKVSGEKAIIIK